MTPNAASTLSMSGPALPHDGELAENERVKVVVLPTIETMASMIHRGGFSSMNPAYSAIFQWIEANGYHRSGPGRELTLAYEPGGDETKFVTEIRFPFAMESPDVGVAPYRSG